MVGVRQEELVSSPVNVQPGRTHERRQAWGTAPWCPCESTVTKEVQFNDHISKVRISQTRKQMTQEYPWHSTEKGQGSWLQSLLVYSRPQQKTNLIFSEPHSYSGSLMIHEKMRNMKRRSANIWFCITCSSYADTLYRNLKKFYKYQFLCKFFLHKEQAVQHLCMMCEFHLLLFYRISKTTFPTS